MSSTLTPEKLSRGKSTPHPSMLQDPDAQTPYSLHVFAVALAVATFLLVIAGGLVTSTGSALAVPDWPLSYGRFFPPMVGGVLFEHGHRMIAATVGFLTVVLAAALWITRSPRIVRVLGLWAVGVVIAQGLLGGMTVLLKLPLAISVAHACLGQTYFSLMTALAFLTGREALSAFPIDYDETAKIQRLALMTTGFVFLQLLAGSMVRHSGRLLHWHLLGALLVTIHVILLSRRILKDPVFESDFRTPALALLNFLGVQLVLGFYSWRMPLVAVTTTHLAMGALIYATSVLLCIKSFLRLKRA